ncbi:hypothetical protein KRP22_011150 [Phytophthora ramorum]|nr:Major facilitator superfamily domain-containing protein 6-like protein B [Phytophthora ramorum]
MGFRLGFIFDGGEAKELIPLKLLYVIHYFAFSMQTYLPIYFDTTAHFSKAQIGVLLAIPCICAIISTPIWGAIADGIHNQKLTHAHEAEHHEKGELIKSLKAILRQHDVLLLFVIVILAGILGGLIDNLLFLYLFHLSGDNPHIVGVVIAVETLSELPFFFHANKIIERFGTPKCILASLIAYGIRMFTYAFVQHPWLVLPIETLHGLTYGLLLAAFTNYIYGAAPKGTEGTMIGVLFAVQRGIGGGLSTLVGGWIYGALGGRTMWGIAGFIVFPLSLLATAGFAHLARDYAAQSPTASKEDSGSITSDESSLLATSTEYGTKDVSAQC